MDELTPPTGRQFRWFHITKHQYLWDIAAVATDGTAWETTVSHGDVSSARWRQLTPLDGA